MMPDDFEDMETRATAAAGGCVVGIFLLGGLLVALGLCGLIKLACQIFQSPPPTP